MNWTIKLTSCAHSCLWKIWILYNCWILQKRRTISYFMLDVKKCMVVSVAMAWLEVNWVLLWFCFALVLGPVVLLPWMFIFLICERTWGTQVVSCHLVLWSNSYEAMLSLFSLIAPLRWCACSWNLCGSWRLTPNWYTIMVPRYKWPSRLWRKFH